VASLASLAVVAALTALTPLAALSPLAALTVIVAVENTLGDVRHDEHATILRRGPPKIGRANR